MPKLAQDLLPIINHKLDAVVPSDIRRFDKYVSQFDDVVKLTLGEPDLNTPEHIKQAAIRNIENNDSHYGPQSGKPELLKGNRSLELQLVRPFERWRQGNRAHSSLVHVHAAGLLDWGYPS